MECLHAMRTLAMVLADDPEYPASMWSSFYRSVNRDYALCGCPGQYLLMPRHLWDRRMGREPD